MLNSRVRVDYEQLAAIAQAFGQQAEAARQMLGALKDGLETLQGGDWVGQSADKFYAEMNTSVLPAVQRVAAAMSQAASTTAKISQIMKQAEDQSAALFRLDGTPGLAGAGSASAGSAALGGAAGPVAGAAGVGAGPLFSAPQPGAMQYIPGALNASKAERVLEFIAMWGRNASPWTVVSNYLQLNWNGIKFWIEVGKAAGAGKALLSKIERLEGGARALAKATGELNNAELQLPSYPLKADFEGGSFLTTPAELEYVEKYMNTAAIITNDALNTRVKLDEAIAGWDAAVAQANKTRDFTRKAAWEAITKLDMRFNNEGGSFRAYLVDARNRAAWVEQSARMKQHHASYLLGQWTPDWYRPPSPHKVPGRQTPEWRTP